MFERPHVSKGIKSKMENRWLKDPMCCEKPMFGKPGRVVDNNGKSMYKGRWKVRSLRNIFCQSQHREISIFFRFFITSNDKIDIHESFPDYRKKMWKSINYFLWHEYFPAQGQWKSKNYLLLHEFFPYYRTMKKFDKSLKLHWKHWGIRKNQTLKHWVYGKIKHFTIMIINNWKEENVKK